MGWSGRGLRLAAKRARHSRRRERVRLALEARARPSRFQTFRGHIRVHLRYGPVTRPFPIGRSVDRLQIIGFPPTCYPSDGSSDFCPGRSVSGGTGQPSLDARFRHFVTSMPAPVASGWSGCRLGLAPTGNRRLFTAHVGSASSPPRTADVRQAFDACWHDRSLNDPFGDLISGRRTAGYVCCTLKSVIGAAIFWLLGRLEVAECRRTWPSATWRPTMTGRSWAR